MSVKQTIEDKVSRYIKMKSFFQFSDAMMVTGATKDKLEDILAKYEDEGLIKLDENARTITQRFYTVIDKKVIKKPENLPPKPFDMSLIRPLEKVIKRLQNYNKKTILYTQLLNISRLSRGIYSKVVKHLKELNILTCLSEDKSFTQRQLQEFEIDQEKIEVLLTFLKQKKYEEVQLILDGKKALVYVHLPKDLVSILEVIKSNEVLKRDELSKMAKITRKRLTDWWQTLKKIGVVTHSFKEFHNERLTYVFSAKRAKAVLKALENGAYERDMELRQLWLKR